MRLGKARAHRRKPGKTTERWRAEKEINERAGMVGEPEILGTERYKKARKDARATWKQRERRMGRVRMTDKQPLLAR